MAQWSTGKLTRRLFVGHLIIIVWLEKKKKKKVWQILVVTSLCQDMECKTLLRTSKHALSQQKVIDMPYLPSIFR